MAKPKVLLFDNPKVRRQLLPFTFTRPVAAVRIGILTIAEKWHHELGTIPGFVTEDYLSIKFKGDTSDENLFIDGSLLPNADLISAIESLNVNEVLEYEGDIIAAKLDKANAETFNPTQSGLSKITLASSIQRIGNCWDIFSMNGDALKDDFERITSGRQSAMLHESNQALGSENIFIEEGAKVHCATLNATTGPIYIGKDAEVMEGSIIRGPFALCDHSATKLGTKIYGPTTIGPHSKVGGEINNSVIFGYSNKAHDGFLGNSVIGEWCNLGADTNNSNLKNNYTEVDIWNYEAETYQSTGLLFCGLFMGDHSKCGINTMFNTGTVVGVSTNIYGSDFPKKFIPSFSWGSAKKLYEYKMDRALETAKAVMTRRSLELDEIEQGILENVFDQTKKYRSA